MSLLYNFLQKNSVNSSNSLPLVHTTKAHYLRELLSSNEIIAQECNVFEGEKLNYFFVGRPAYKFELSGDAEFWELPICFIMNYDLIRKSKRIFPFDSGGFKKKLMPSFITDFELDQFEISKEPLASEKIIGTFFNNSKNYFRLKGREDIEFGKFHDISMLDAEIHAVHRLSVLGEKTSEDRNFSIEAQIEENIPLDNANLLAVVVPAPYMDDLEFLETVEKVWNCDLISYDIYPLNPNTYYYGIYNSVENYFRDKGFFT